MFYHIPKSFFKSAFQNLSLSRLEKGTNLSNNKIMDFIFVSMPYARFISKWFANVPNINLGIMQAFLKGKGKSVKTFHFHLEFLPYLKGLPPGITENLIALTEQYGVEYMGLDYIFASLLFEDEYLRSKGRFSERLDSLGLSLNDFEQLRQVVLAFTETVFSRLSPYLKGTKLIGFSCSHYQLSGSLLLCSRIKSAYPDILTVFGGKDCSGAFAYDLLKNMDFVDFVGTSECEVTVDSLLEHIGDERKEICNVIFRDKHGDIRKAKYRQNVSINSLPFPEYDFNNFPVEKKEIILPIEFGRGCPWKRCTFCPDESYNILCQAKKSGRIRSEIDHYQSISKDLGNFFILDSDALKDPKTILELSGYLEDKNLNFIYAEFRAERMDKKVLAAIKRFGNWVSNFQIGIETFSERILQLMNKGVTALKNVEVLKAAAELAAPVQFNLFTCFPGMKEDDLEENIRVMDLIRHIILRENIQIYPGEFYLPSDCPVFLHAEDYGIKRHSDSIFSLIFEDLKMPSFSNYPYPYEFDNDEEQYRMSRMIRSKVEEIKSKNPSDNFMVYKNSPDGLRIDFSRDGNRVAYTLNGREKEIYLSAIEKSVEIEKLCGDSGMAFDHVSTFLNDFEQKGLILYSSDRKSFLSLAMNSNPSI
jgi:hypothetical protein